MNDLLPFPWNVIVPIAVALIATAPGLIAFIKQRRRSKAETADILTTAAERLWKGMEIRITSLTTEVSVLRKESQQARSDLNMALEKVEDLERKSRAQTQLLTELLRGIKALTVQLIDAGMTPVWTPRSKTEVPSDLDKFA
jgi:flagellar motility protein MotE (MotC chaperone)